jgi:hypothetical protein
MKWILKNNAFHIAGFTSTKRPVPVTSGCSTTEFYCDNKCIPGVWKCDNFDDCNDKTDEQFCGKIILSHRNAHKYR